MTACKQTLCSLWSRSAAWGFVATLMVASTTLFLTGTTFAASTGDALASQASWELYSGAEVTEQLMEWRKAARLDESQRLQVDAIWDGADDLSGPVLLDRVLAALAVGSPPVERLLPLLTRKDVPHPLPTLSDVDNLEQSSLVRNNLRLAYGMWLANHRLYDEALEQLSGLEPNDVVDPASLLFYQGVIHYRLLDKESGLERLARLLEHSEKLPRRYATVARLMEADLKPLKEDSLGEVARLMDNIHIRLGHGRAGKRVRDEEEKVISKLDKMIKELEDQAKKSSRSSSSANGSQSSKPMEDSQAAGGKGPGNVTPNRLGADTDWGNLPPKQREETLQQLGKEFPSHYREIIEEYFRQLARDQDGS